MLKVLAIVAVLAASGLTQAQTTKKELVARVLQLQQPGIEGMARQLAEQPARQMLQQAAPALQKLSAERREAVARDIEADVRKYVDETAPFVIDRAVKLAPSTIGALLEERMTEDELRQVIAVLESPANKKFQGLGAEMQRVIGEKLIGETRGEVETRVRALDQSVARRLGITAPAGGASAPKPAAPARKP